MKKRKAQLTIFIIIAILIISVVVLFFLFKDNLKIGKPTNPETAEIQNFVQECLDDSLEKVVFRVGENGGYYFPPKLSTPVLEIPYYIKNNKNLMPSKENIENEISKYVSRELIICLGDFALFANEYEITKSKMNPPEVIIEPERVLIELNYPLTIIKGDSKSKLEDFSSEISVRLGIVYDAVAEFVAEDLKEEGMCVSCLSDVSEKYQILIDGHYSEETSDIIFIAIDEEEYFEKSEEVFKYVFAIEQK
ncbi:MAG: hypothetical protein Q8O84_00415 [Nanoarchaeota archaeon]|nr:hypothetical protein [Nanoarchaeota archaeon]